MKEVLRGPVGRYRGPRSRMEDAKVLTGAKFLQDAYTLFTGYPLPQPQ